MNDLEDFLSGKLSVDCKNKAEASGICDLMQECGIDVGALRTVSRGGFRVDVGRKLRGAYSSTSAEWHVRNGFTQRWMPYADFAASCDLADQQISIITLDDFV